MAEICPFRALYYDQKKVKGLEKVIVPPYDVISDEEKKAFFKKSRFNFARIILGNKRDRYQSVAKTFRQWQKDGILVEDDLERFYFLEQSFLKKGKILKRRGIVAAVSLDDFKKGKILPHEATLKAPKLDRLEILTACQSNLSPIFMMYGDPKRSLDKKILKRCQRPFLKMKDSQGGSVKIWKIEDLQLEAWIQRELLKKNLYIIDGHHRFATALTFYEMGKKQSKRERSHRYVLSVLANMNDPAVVIYPIYRFLKRVKGFHKKRYLSSLKMYFNIRKMRGRGDLKKHQWGILFRNDPYFYLLSIGKTKKNLLKKKLQGHAVVKGLDVSVLQNVIIPKTYDSEIRYVRGMGERLRKAIRDVRKGEYEALWMVNAPTMDDLKRVSDARQTMPPKSTFFYPKLLSGLLIRSF